MLQRILDTAAERSWQVTSVNLDTLTESAFVKLLADMDYKKDYQIIIDCELDRLNSILNLVKHQLSDAKKRLIISVDSPLPCALMLHAVQLQYKYYSFLV